MKKISLILVAILFSISLFSQKIEVKTETKKITEK